MDTKELLKQMTVEEKARLLQGADFWHTQACDRLGIPAIMVSDGPHGLRKQKQDGSASGANDSITAVCFPTAVGTASSFDEALLEDLGENLGSECSHEEVSVLLGPAANIKRSPLCGRNFEYFSEDPLLSGRMAGAITRGIQKTGTGACLKHFACNNQETRRMTVSAQVSERALREIYLASFETTVKSGHPWSVMCSYNKVNGTYSSENKWLLTDVLRKEWGFDGLAMTDWGACNDHIAGVKAGLELEMPHACKEDDEAIVQALQSGKLTMEELDQAAERVLKLIERTQISSCNDEEFDWGQQHHMARKIARESMVLLKNENNILPIRGNKKVAFIGKFAKQPRFQGGGSSHINCSEVSSALMAVRSVSAVTYAQGFDTETDAVNEVLQQEAIEAAKNADIAVLFLGLPEVIESEGYDRKNLDLPYCQTELLAKISQVQKNIVVVLHNGAPVVMPWIDRVSAVLEAYLGGQAGGAAVVDLLFGAVSPCGKLAETFPLRLEDTPCYLSFPGEHNIVPYTEGIYVGYRYYDKKKMDVLFPFGHGLTYTTFQYSNLTVNQTIYHGGPLSVSVDVTNTGNFAAKEIVQFYVRNPQQGSNRPVRELRAFSKVYLEPQETKTVSVCLDERAFSYWNDTVHAWYTEPGEYQIEAAASSRDIRAAVAIKVQNDPLPAQINPDMTLADVQKIPGAPALPELLQGISGLFSAGDQLGEATNKMLEAMINETPLHSLVSFADGKITRADISKLINLMNQSK